MYTYVIKKLGRQELGSQNLRGGKTNRGRYMLISLNNSISAMFPVLSSTVCNDNALITLNRSRNQIVEKIYCNYVYHNSKLQSGQANGRNELRIYFPQCLDQKQMFEGDYVVFRRVKENDLSCSDYYFEFYSPSNPHFSDIQAVFNSRTNIPGAKNYALYVGNLPFYEALFTSSVQTTQNATVIQPSAPQVVLAPSVVQRVGNLAQGNQGLMGFSQLFKTSADFRNFVMVTYNNTCCVTDTSLSWGGLNNIEAAHIWPKAHKGQFLPTNGLALRRDIHWAFDKGFFTLDDDLKVFVHPLIRRSNNYLCQYHQKKITIYNTAFPPDLNFVHYHQKHIFGMFLNQGVIRSNP